MAKKKSQLIKTRLGEREVSPDGIIYFPRGLIGFDDQREFALLTIKEGSPFLLLQSTTKPSMGFLVADPYSFLDDYDVKMGSAEKKILRLENVRQIAVLVTVTIPHGKPEETTLNLSGPIVINTEAKIGMQVPQTDPGLSTHHRLGDPATVDKG